MKLEHRFGQRNPDERSIAQTRGRSYRRRGSNEQVLRPAILARPPALLIDVPRLRVGGGRCGAAAVE